MHPTKQAMDFLRRSLDLPASGHEQDWDIELADAARSEQFIAFLQDRSLDSDTKTGLMALILASLEQRAHGGEIPRDLWARLASVLVADRSLYADVVADWLPREKDGDEFAISADLLVIWRSDGSQRRPPPQKMRAEGPS